MKTVPLLLSLMLPVCAISQDSSNLSKPPLLYGLAAYDIPKGFGFTIGASAPFRSVTRSKKDSEKSAVIFSEFGEYRYPFVYTSILFNAGVGLEYVRSAKRFSELSVGQGLLRTIYDGEVYELDQNGNIKERKLFGRTYLITQFSYAVNYRMYKRSANSWFIQIRPSTWLQYPYNGFLRLHFSLQAGISYTWKNHAFS